MCIYIYNHLNIYIYSLHKITHRKLQVSVSTLQPSLNDDGDDGDGDDGGGRNGGAHPGCSACSSRTKYRNRSHTRPLWTTSMEETQIISGANFAQGIRSPLFFFHMPYSSFEPRGKRELAGPVAPPQLLRPSCIVFFRAAAHWRIKMQLVRDGAEAKT